MAFGKWLKKWGTGIKTTSNYPWEGAYLVRRQLLDAIWYKLKSSLQ